MLGILLHRLITRINHRESIRLFPATIVTTETKSSNRNIRYLCLREWQHKWSNKTPSIQNKTKREISPNIKSGKRVALYIFTVDLFKTIENSIEATYLTKSKREIVIAPLLFISLQKSGIRNPKNPRVITYTSDKYHGLEILHPSYN